MTNKKIKSILNKKYTGKQLGQLLMASILHDIKQQKQGKTPEALFNPKDFEKLEKSLETKQDYLEYGIYSELYSSIIELWNYNQTMVQRYSNGYFRLWEKITELHNTEAGEYSFNQTPYIVTEKQYEDLKEEAQKILEDRKSSYVDLVFTLLFECLDEEPIAPKIITDTFRQYRDIEVTQASLIYSYNQLYGLGYYILPNGLRSDRVDIKEWQKAIQEEFSERYELILNGEKASIRETMQEYNLELMYKGLKVFFRGTDHLQDLIYKKTGERIPEKDLEHSIRVTTSLYNLNEYEGKYNPDTVKRSIQTALGYEPLAEWHTYEEAQDKVTMFDLLDLIIDKYQAGKDKEAYKELKKDYPELLGAIQTYIGTYLEEAKGLKANQLYNDRWTYKELADAGIFTYDRRTAVTNQDILQVASDNLEKKIQSTETIYSTFAAPRTSLRGIAIIKNPSQTELTEDGYYIENTPPRFYDNLELAGTDEELPNKIATYIDNYMYGAVRSVYAFNELLKIIESVYDIKDLYNIAHLDTIMYENQANKYNKFLYLFYSGVNGYEVQKARKKQIIKSIFYEVDLDSQKPTKEAIKNVTELFTSYGLTEKAKKKYRYLDDYIAMLTMDLGGNNDR